MVFRSDPRAGYCKVDFNVEWFYQYLDERGEELVVTPTSETGYEFCADELAFRERCLDKYLERAVEFWIGYSVFGNKSPRIILYKEMDMSGYESVWDVMYDVMLEYIDKNPHHFTLKHIDETCMECNKDGATFEAKNDKNKIVTLHTKCVPTYVEKSGDTLSLTY
jgi:hypothetical protein